MFYENWETFILMLKFLPESKFLLLTLKFPPKFKFYMVQQNTLALYCVETNKFNYIYFFSF